MTKRIALGVLSLALLLSAPSWAAPSASWLSKSRIHLESGFSVPRSPQEFSDYWKTGFGLGAGLETPMARHASLCLDFDYTYCGMDRDRFMSDIRAEAATRGFPTLNGVTVLGGDANFVTLLAGLKLDASVPGSFSPYLKVGAGFARATIDEANFSFLVRSFVANGTVPSEMGTKFAFSAGAGIERRLKGSRAGYNLEARWVSIATEGKATQMVPVRLGVFLGF